MSSIQKNNVARIVNEPADADAIQPEAAAPAEAANAEARPAAAPVAPAAAAPVAPPQAEKKRRSPVLPIIVVVALIGGG